MELDLPSIEFERKFSYPLAGVDEVGRGTLAGPVVAAAVILDYNNIPEGIKDSKKIVKRKREQICKDILSSSITSIGLATSGEIDKINILKASLLAMKRAIEDLKKKPNIVLIDGSYTPEIAIQSKSIIKGDNKSISIAAASIVAKVYRDNLMIEFDKQYPKYGFLSHKGYGTKAHKEAILKYGPTSIHRMTFKGVVS